MNRNWVCLCLLLLVAARSFGQDVYQFSVPFGKGRAYLWIPPAADRIRGALVGSQTLMEEAFAADPAIREACASEKLAIVFCSSSIGYPLSDPDAGKRMEEMLRQLGDASGYRELSVAPILPYGHSVATLYVRDTLYWKPGRCFAGFLQKGGGIQPPPAATASLAGMPVLALKGQYEEFGPGPSGILRSNETREAGWQGVRADFLEHRARDGRFLLSLLVDPGASHMAWPPKAAHAVGLFIRKAAQARIPDWPVDATEPPALRTVDPRGGALSRGDLENRAGPQADLAGSFLGAASNAFWHFDLELARAADAFHTPIHSGKPQYVAFADPKGNPIPPGHDMRLKVSPVWTGPDTFQVSGTFWKRPLLKYPPIGGEAGHASTPILFRVFSGAMEQIDPGVFRLGYQPRGNGRPAILAFHPGDAEYAGNEQPAFITAANRNAGKAQVLTWGAIPETVRADSKPVPLRASSDAGLPVRFVVESGPAVVRGDMLCLTPIPPRSRFPVPVVVWAYQTGSAVAPLTQDAAPVSRTIAVEK